eukprot:TRINITY_DN10311_c0_g1_i2.p1 TRINITY_DN10311_c0_g1~~TRINITY_DN10311_c0_g1_i2.p1  ORF type:complete len:674 (-),score=104.65 TRINITY_DN10311_c0_g1_i2:72-2093(-)
MASALGFSGFSVVNFQKLPLPSEKSAKDIACGFKSTIVLMTDGTVFGAGLSSVAGFRPLAVPGNYPISRIAAEDAVFALTDEDARPTVTDQTAEVQEKGLTAAHQKFQTEETLSLSFSTNLDAGQCGNLSIEATVNVADSTPTCSGRDNDGCDASTAGSCDPLGRTCWADTDEVYCWTDTVDDCTLLESNGWMLETDYDSVSQPFGVLDGRDPWVVGSETGVTLQIGFGELLVLRAISIQGADALLTPTVVSIETAEDMDGPWFPGESISCSENGDVQFFGLAPLTTEFVRLSFGPAFDVEAGLSVRLIQFYGSPAPAPDVEVTVIPTESPEPEVVSCAGAEVAGCDAAKLGACDTAGRACIVDSDGQHCWLADIVDSGCTVLDTTDWIGATNSDFAAAEEALIVDTTWHGGPYSGTDWWLGFDMGKMVTLSHIILTSVPGQGPQSFHLETADSLGTAWTAVPQTFAAMDTGDEQLFVLSPPLSTSAVRLVMSSSYAGESGLALQLKFLGSPSSVAGGAEPPEEALNEDDSGAPPAANIPPEGAPETALPPEDPPVDGPASEEPIQEEPALPVGAPEPAPLAPPVASPATATYQWYRQADLSAPLEPILGAVGLTYNPVIEDLFHYLHFEVVPLDAAPVVAQAFYIDELHGCSVYASAVGSSGFLKHSRGRTR